MMRKAKEPICPYLKKSCIKDDCMMWMTLRGYDHNKGEEVDNDGCCISFIPSLLVDNTQKNRETGAAVESFRNEVHKQNHLTLKLLHNNPNVELINQTRDKR